VNLRWDSKFAKPFFVNGVSYCLSIFIGYHSDDSIFCKFISDALYEFFLLSAVNVGPNKYACILKLGHSGNGVSGVGIVGALLICWHCRQV
jgi:hypothetical protein